MQQLLLLNVTAKLSYPCFPVFFASAGETVPGGCANKTLSLRILLQVQSATVPMTRDEIVAYRPGQDPEFDPSAGQAAPAAPAVPKRQVMSTTDIAAYRPGEDPAYDPVERRGWWDVNIAQGTYLTQMFGKQSIDCSN